MSARETESIKYKGQVQSGRGGGGGGGGGVNGAFNLNHQRLFV